MTVVAGHGSFYHNITQCSHVTILGPWAKFHRVASSLRCSSFKTSQLQGEKGTRQRGAKQEQRRRELDSYRSRFATALEAELMEEMEAMKERLKNWSKTRLENEGLALFDLSVRLDGYIYRDTVLRFYISHGDGLLPTGHQFSQGDVIVISRRNPLEDKDSAIEGTVMERASRFLKVAVPSGQVGNLDLRLKWRLDLSANRVAYERCLWAINAFASPQIRPGTSETTCRITSSKPPSSGIAPEGVHTMGEGVMAFRDILIKAEPIRSERLQERKIKYIAGNTDSLYRTKDQTPNGQLTQEALTILSTPPSRVAGNRLGAAKLSVSAQLKEMGKKANTSQKDAIQTAMLRRISLWQGPPGTGKTRTLVQFIQIFCKQCHGQVLACADSNIAVDNLVEGLLGEGIRVVRVGQPVKVKEELQGSTLAARVSAHPFMKKADQFRRDSKSKRNLARQNNNDKKRKGDAIEATKLWEKASELEEQAVKAVLDGVEVIAVTCVGSADPVLDGRKFQACVIDEATQATEPATLIPILRSGADTVVLVGDPAQLPPTVISRDALENGLSTSLFGRLQECGLEPLLLNRQYRMHPFLAMWPSAMFYGSQLLSHVMPSERPIPKGIDWLDKTKPLVFINCANGAEQTTAFGNSFFNQAEALQVFLTVEHLVNDESGDIRSNNIGVISPYSAQVRLLQDMFLKAGDKSRLSDLEVKTVDGFQGREKEVIVVSTVRANSEGRLGFVADPRRMNVSLTRCRRGLVVIGNLKTLQSSHHWGDWLDMVKKEKLLIVDGWRSERIGMKKSSY